MHGYLRMLLAMLVALSHFAHGPANGGVSAVVVFYILAGLVVSQLLERHFPPGRLWAFYLERVLRIYPLYLFILAVTLCFLLVTGFGSADIRPGKILAHVLVIPLNYYMLMDLFVVGGLLMIPTAWSLAAELQAYLVLPWLVRRCFVKWLTGIGSMAVFTASALGALDADTWGYRVLPGILYAFLAGVALGHVLKSPRIADSFDRIFPAMTVVWMALLGAAVGMTDDLHPFTQAVLLGYVLGVPIVAATTRIPLRLPGDALLGRLSYGFFLIHLPVGWAFEHVTGRLPASYPSFIMIVIASIGLAWVGTWLVEKPVWRWRKVLTQSG